MAPPHGSNARHATAPTSSAGTQQRQTFSAGAPGYSQGPNSIQPGITGHASAGPSRMLICGDIGGTKVLLALAEQNGDSLRWRLERRYMSRDYPDLSAMFADFMRIASDAALYPSDITGGCLAVAGPVSEHGRRAKLTNLPWEVDAQALASSHGTGPIRLVNDFAAAAAGVDAVEPSTLADLQTGEMEKRGPRLVIGAGTGLGVATMFWQGGADGSYKVVGGEGGHIGFAPTNELQAELWRYLARDGRRVSNEHIASGPGLVSVLHFFQQRAGLAIDAAAKPETIAAQAYNEPQGIAARALDMFFRVYGAATGDLALATMPRGGVYIAGGIAARLLPQMQAGPFIEAFNDKAPHDTLMRRFPVRVVTDLELGLKGAARIACGRAQV
jgi:glucokinase